MMGLHLTSWISFACVISAVCVLRCHGINPASQASSVDSVTHQPPLWPDTYKLSFTFSMPNVFHTQPNGLSYPVTIWHDEANHRQRVEVMGGVDTVITLDHAEYSIYPRINVTTCEIYKGHLSLPSTLPDLSRFDYAGEFELSPGQLVDIWQYQFREGDRTSQYTMYVLPTGVPIKFYMTGFNYETDSHFDEYLYDFTSMDKLSATDANKVFDPPAVCNDTPSLQRPARPARHPLALQLGALLPGVRSVGPSDESYALWSLRHGRVHSDEHEYQTRLARYQQVVQDVHQHNAKPGVTYRRAVTRFADWSDDEFLSVMLPKRLMPDSLRDRSKAVKGFTPAAVFDVDETLELPKTVDWRGTGADVGVKDQAMCGSCFTFAAVAAMQGAWYVATGQRRSFSEQQLVDCSWDYGYNSGCFGGDYQPCITYIAESGGIALEQEYPYDGVNNLCRAQKHTRSGQFSGFVEIPSRNERALMQALHQLGPIAVAVDAGPESFRFYSEGVWSDPECKTNMRSLDHAVTAFGYGTTPEGVDYWLIQNTWSKLYGEDGYIKIARGQHDCGISTDPATAKVVKDFEVAGMREAKMREAVRA